jgi:threonine/homoserine/homoserine lactone efflux protein
MVELTIAVLAGAGIGFLLAVPAIGPVSISVVRSSLVQGRHAGFWAAAGAATVDALLCLLMLMATGFVGTVVGFLGAHPLLSLSIQLLCVLVLIGYGIAQLRLRTSRLVGAAPTRFASFLDRLQRRGHFLLGMGVALTNLANPAFPSSLAYLGVVAHQFQLVSAEHFGSLLGFALGFGIGNLGWLMILSQGVHRFRHRLSGEALERLYRLVGAALIGVGTVLGIRILAATRWHDILRLLPVL